MRPDKSLKIFAIVGVVLVLLAVPLPEVTNRYYLLRLLKNALHFPLFACVTLALLWVVKPKRIRVIGLCALAMVGLAIGSEIIQALSSRHESSRDVVNNLIGVIFSVAIWMFYTGVFDHKGKSIRHIIMTVAMMALIAGIIPAANSFMLWHDKNNQLPTLFNGAFRNAELMTESLAALEEVDIQIQGEQVHVKLLSGKTPGIVVWGFLQNWRGYSAVSIDLENPGAESLSMQVHIRDKNSGVHFEDRFNHRISLSPYSRQKLIYRFDDIVVGPENNRLDIEQMSVIALYRIEGTADQFILYSVDLVK